MLLLKRKIDSRIEHYPFREKNDISNPIMGLFLVRLFNKTRNVVNSKEVNNAAYSKYRL